VLVYGRLCIRSEASNCRNHSRFLGETDAATTMFNNWCLSLEPLLQILTVPLFPDARQLNRSRSVPTRRSSRIIRALCGSKPTDNQVLRSPTGSALCEPRDVKHSGTGLRAATKGNNVLAIGIPHRRSADTTDRRHSLPGRVAATSRRGFPLLFSATRLDGDRFVGTARELR
jgi:hypothetical protein